MARDRVYPALVHVKPIRELYVGGRRRLTTATGSGVVIDEKGHCITNYHVSGKAARSICTLSDGSEVRATLVGGDPLTDLAVIRLDTEALRERGVELRWAELRAEVDQSDQRGQLGPAKSIWVGDGDTGGWPGHAASTRCHFSHDQDWNW